jgi:hypothetical protein
MDKNEKDVEQVVRYLTTTFNKARAPLARAHRDTHSGVNDTYVMETEFAYRLNEVMKGPRSTLQNNIALCNDFINETIIYVTEQKALAEKQ